MVGSRSETLTTGNVLRQSAAVNRWCIVAVNLKLARMNVRKSNARNLNLIHTGSPAVEYSTQNSYSLGG